MTALLRAPYPTNVRQLRAAVWEAIRASGDGPLSLPPHDHRPPAGDGEDEGARAKAGILAALERQRWNVTRTAEAMGITRYALIRRMKKYGVTA